MRRRDTEGASTWPMAGTVNTGHSSKKSLVRQDMRPDSNRCTYCGPHACLQPDMRLGKSGTSVRRQKAYRTCGGDDLLPVLDNDVDVRVCLGDKDGLRSDPAAHIDEN